jgi:hypothetical protein
MENVQGAKTNQTNKQNNDMLCNNAVCNYSETSLNRPALGPKNMAVLDGWPVF